MRNMRAFFFLFILLLVTPESLLAQKNKWVWGPSVGYQYQSGNFLKVSGWNLFALNSKEYIKVDAGANFTWMMDKTTVIPELGFTYYMGEDAFWPALKAEVTPYTFTPKIGIGLICLVDIAVGYGFDLRTKSMFKPVQGFTASVNFNIPFNLTVL
ncbi:Uncharacterised protein [Sphingobacterium spiritivorum]|uniref:Outer membrane protein beta-barrel domain-containing protein n=1 Tax=Sphingobacterium spiritivorum TaxID=258 RepID=A0A380C9R7_SPHSI|nr:hypothetical protein [Sphingobacterium spiritivorum]SUJ16168.1 Uncharacterised protein [Sphingobacterium spiritivorum]